jgi:bifunctional DNA-binding transcriptional regulator/antitoxin component of YhaV-PrlF toxin-antitoxin module
MNRNYVARIEDDEGTITIPKGIVQGFGIEVGDDLEWLLGEDGCLYVRVIHNPWQAPEWMYEDEPKEDENGG